MDYRKVIELQVVTMNFKINLFLFLVVFSFPLIGYAQEPNVEIEYLFKIGEGLEFGDPGYPLSPRSVTSDLEGNIFVSDYRKKTVDMYSKEGDYLKSFGRGGRGPGEFNRLSAIATDSKGRLLVLDRMSFKLARFNTDDGDVEEHFFEDMNEINMMTLVPLEGERFAGIYVELARLSEAPDTLKAIRVYEFGEGEKQSSHYEIYKHLFDKSKPFEEYIGGGLGHSLTSLGDQKVAVSHRTYKGKISIVNLTNNEVLDTQSPQVQEPYYLIFENESLEELTEKGISGLASRSGRGKSYRYQTLYYSHLLEGSGKYLFHIYSENEPEGLFLSKYLEIFSEKGEFKYVTSISDSFPEKEGLRQGFLHIDENLRLFVRNYYEDRDPEVHVYQLILNGIN